MSHPYLGGSVRDALILFDKTGALAAVQRTVAGRFMESRWLRERLSSLMVPIERNAIEFAVAVRERDEPEICRASGFAMWTICDALLVRFGLSPSWVRGLQKLGDALPLERDCILEFESASTLSPADVSGFLPLFQRGMGAESGVMLCVRQELEWMVQHELHREALHSLWSGVGLAVRAGMASGKAGEERQAGALARAWLTRIGWNDAELARKVAQLGDCVRHVARVLHVPG